MLRFAPAAANPSLRPTFGNHLTAQMVRSVSVCVATQLRASTDQTLVLPSNDLRKTSASNVQPAAWRVQAPVPAQQELARAAPIEREDPRLVAQQVRHLRARCHVVERDDARVARRRQQGVAGREFDGTDGRDEALENRASAQDETKNGLRLLTRERVGETARVVVEDVQTAVLVTRRRVSPVYGLQSLSGTGSRCSCRSGDSPGREPCRSSPLSRIHGSSCVRPACPRH